ncbi:unnamed protein product [Dovyalis caffra]|uniref:F-box associated beta-propeller type 3 domain-containing protein n=1 Tax=Dovyalis caffra TaxID=77055 RepID=A0AAV1R0B9_9ROSI|nr:unnamed protein product [Dovyalis caffra]
MYHARFLLSCEICRTLHEWGRNRKAFTTPIYLYEGGSRFTLPPDNPPPPKTGELQLIHLGYPLGYDPLRDEYKVLSVRTMVDKSKEHHISSIYKIFTVGTNSWREIRTDIPSILRPHKYCVCVYV